MTLVRKRLPWLLLLSAVVIFLDRATKSWVSARLPIGGALPVIPHVLRISHWMNDGAAFSLFAGSASPQMVRWGLVGVSLTAALIVLVILVRLAERMSATTVALALILAGALGNAHDRIVYGSVVDFIEVRIYHYHWPDFNVPDSAVVVGACLLLLDSLLTREGEAEDEEESL